MGKSNRRRTNRDDNSSRGDGSTTSAGDDHKMGSAGGSVVSSSSSHPPNGDNNDNEPSSSTRKSARQPRRSIYHWCLREKQGILWVWGWLIMGSLLGFGVGSGWLMGEYGKPPSSWRINLGGKIRANPVYKSTLGSLFANGDSFWENERVRLITDVTNGVLGALPFSSNRHDYSTGIHSSNDPFSSNWGAPTVVVRKVDPSELKKNPSHPYIYAVLREAITREKGGYVHPDLGILEPAPSGAARGIGMVRNRYHQCQSKCIPGIAEEKLKWKRMEEDIPSSEDRRYMQEEVLIKVPLSFQMTRKVALDALLPRITSESQRKTVHELDDAALLALLLAHERGVGQYSRWLPYIASLPIEPSCGYSQKHRPYLLDTINALRDEMGMDVDGWPGELIRATELSERIVTQLATDYGSFLQHPKGISAKSNIRWALCQVASRATGGSQKHGALRMIPLLDMINHDAQAGAFVELRGTERLEKGDFLDSINDEIDGGTFVIRSRRHGRRKALRVGQELMVNYNVPHYSGLDWLVSSGFVPPELYQNWLKLDAPLPRIRRDGPFADIHDNGSSTTGRTSSNSRQQEPSSDFFKVFSNDA